jgi:uncharacterized protein YecT (DUF1311 family)
MLLMVLAALAAPVAEPCGPGAIRSACPEAAAMRAEAELAAVAKALPGAIDAINEAGMERSGEDVAAWKARAAEVVSLWIAFRDARCDPALLRFEGQAGAVRSGACRARISRAAAADLGFRYDLGKHPLGRGDAETEATAPRPSAEDAGPCAHPPPAECDYCGMNQCWEARLKADDTRLNAAWRRALATIAARPGLPAAGRADWTARLRAAQRAWLRWRDANCDLERLETPNPWAHSIYALVTGPCLARETEARTAVLARTYGR